MSGEADAPVDLAPYVSAGTGISPLGALHAHRNIVLRALALPGATPEARRRNREILAELDERLAESRSNASEDGWGRAEE